MAENPRGTKRKRPAAPEVVIIHNIYIYLAALLTCLGYSNDPHTETGTSSSEFVPVLHS